VHVHVYETCACVHTCTQLVQAMLSMRRAAHQQEHPWRGSLLYHSPVADPRGRAIVAEPNAECPSTRDGSPSPSAAHLRRAHDARRGAVDEEPLRAAADELTRFAAAASCLESAQALARPRRCRDPFVNGTFEGITLPAWERAALMRSKGKSSHGEPASNVGRALVGAMDEWFVQAAATNSLIGSSIRCGGSLGGSRAGREACLTVGIGSSNPLHVGPYVQQRSSEIRSHLHNQGMARTTSRTGEGARRKALSSRALSQPPLMDEALVLLIIIL